MSSVLRLTSVQRAALGSRLRLPCLPRSFSTGSGSSSNSSGNGSGSGYGSSSEATAQDALNAALSQAKLSSTGKGRAPVDYLKLKDAIGAYRVLEEDQAKAVVKLHDALLKDADHGRIRRDQFTRGEKWENELVDDYQLLVASVAEKIRLTVHWNDTAKLTEKERVQATANRVGLQTYETPDEK